MLERLSSLTQHVLEFGRYLRSKGYTTSSSHIQDSLGTIEQQFLTNPAELQLLLRSTLCHSQTEFKDFEGHFRDYWRERIKGEDSKIREEEEPTSNDQPRPPVPSLQQLKDWLHGNHEDDQITAETYSLAPALEDRNFAELSPEEILAMFRMMKKLARRWQDQHTRRFQRSEKIERFDFRRTIREALASQGELLKFRYQKRKRKRYRLVVIADVSRSMQLYSRFVLHFMIALRGLFRDLEAFTFSLDLHHATEDLPGHYHNPEDLQAALGNLVAASGGTEIGRSLQSYVNLYATHQLTRQSKVIIVSDGWDLGDADLIEDAMYRIQRKCRQVIWINPLKGNPGFSPEVRGMKTALPYIDHFTSCHNLKSLEALLPVLFSSRRSADRGASTWPSPIIEPQFS